MDFGILHAIVHPPEQSPGRILREAVVGLVFCYGNIGMSDDGRGDENGSARQKLNDQLQVPEDEVPTLGVVI